MEALPKQITDEIRDILEKCQSGELKHDQSDFHCGTAHCIAGWKQILDYQKTTGDKSALKADFSRNRVGQKVKEFSREVCGYFNAWAYAEDKWQLTEKEADILFNGDSEFPEQFTLLEKLERGERIV